MVSINKEEKDYITKMFPGVHIVRTMRGKSKRHRYYCEEAVAVMNYLKRGKSETSSFGGGCCADRKTGE